MQLILRIKILDLIRAQKSVDQLSIAKSYKHSAKMIFAIQRNFHLTDKIADLLRNKDCLLIPKRDWSLCEALRSMF